MRQIFGFLMGGLLLGACNSPVQNVTTVKLDNNSIVVLDEEKVTEKKTVNLSDFVEDFQVIRFENKDEAFFKYNWMFFSDNYICVRQSGAPVKLFEKSGKYIGNVGNIGQGPGEYRAVYDVLINEKAERIYVMNISGTADILCYDLTGKFVDKFELDEDINKGRMFLSQDASVLSLVHLCFKDRGDSFTGANIQLQNPDSVQYVYVDEIASAMTGKDGKRKGFNDEIWSYRNADDFPFMMSYADTLYHYDSKTNKIQAAFTITMDPEKKGDSFFIFNEWPHDYFVTIAGKRNIIVNKESPIAYEVEFVNDFMGNMGCYPTCQDGYFYQNWEPAQLKDELEEILSSDDCPEDQKGKIKSFMQTLNENDNNILFLGKLKK